MKLPERPTGSMIGLDIGSSAVRAVEVTRGRHGLTLTRFGQVGLPAGAVVGAEVVDPTVVATSIRRLWSEVGFTSRRAVVALSGQRVIVRRAEVPTMSVNDFRSALGFQAMDLIPIPVDDSILDFAVLPETHQSEKQSETMAIVLAAAHRATVQGHLAALTGAGINPVALVPAPAAAATAVLRSGAGDGPSTALVDIGADVTLVTVVERGSVRFSRMLGTGGNDLTGALAEQRSIGHADAEAIKRRGSALGIDQLPPLVGEIESTLGFFASQLDRPLEHVLLTGGATRHEALVELLASQLPFAVGLLDPFEGLDLASLELSEESRLVAKAVAGVSLGCAEWAWASPAARLSLLPGEHAAAARQRRQLFAVAVGVAALAGVLTAAGLHRQSAVHHEQSVLASTTATNASVTAQQARLAPYETAESGIAQRLAVLAQSEQGDVAWAQLLSEISSSMPPHTDLTSLSFTGPTVGGSQSSSSSGAPTSSAGGASAGSTGPYGSLTMTVQGVGTEDQVAIWLRAFKDVPGLQAVWVPSASASGGKVTFTSTGGLVAGVPLVHRSEQQQ